MSGYASCLMKAGRAEDSLAQRQAALNLARTHFGESAPSIFYANSGALRSSSSLLVEEQKKMRMELISLFLTSFGGEIPDFSVIQCFRLGDSAADATAREAVAAFGASDCERVRC